MQAVHDYWRGVSVGGYRFIRSEAPGRGAALQTFSEGVIWRGPALLIHTLFPRGKAHPSYLNFYAGDIAPGVRIPSHGREAYQSTISFKGVLEPAKAPVFEEVGWFLNGKFFPKLEGGGPSMSNVPGRPAAVTNIQINQPVKAYNRKYITNIAPADHTIDGSGVMSKPLNFVPPSTPAALTWLTDANAVYNFPNGWYLANANYLQERLSDGTGIPLWEVSEQWLHAPVRSTI